MCHARRRRLNPDDSPRANESIEAFLKQEMEEWRTDLAISWKRNQRDDAPEFTRKTITDQIRFNVRERVFYSFNSFMEVASCEEIGLMLNVLTNRESRSFPANMKYSEIFLASAFETELDCKDVYMKVPASHEEAMEAYIKALRAIEWKEA